MTLGRLRRLPGTSSPWAAVGTAAFAKIVVMGLSGLLGLFTSRMIIQHFDLAVYAQYGLLASFPGLLPFADLGMAAVVINAVAGSPSVKSDQYVRSAITTAFRILLTAGLIIIGIAVLFTSLGLWPTLLGEGLTEGGSRAALICLVIFGLALPLTVAQRILVGLGRTSTQVVTQAVIAPFIFVSVSLIAVFSLPWGDYLSVLYYLGAALASVICLFLAARALHPQIGRAIRDIPRVRRAPGVRALNLAWPMLVQMVALPIAMQTDRLLLSHLSTSRELASYNLSAQLFGLVLQAIAAGGVALWPIYASARASRTVRSPFRPMMLFVAAGLVLAGLLAALSSWVAQFVSDGKIELDRWLVGGFVAFVVFQAAKYPLAMYLTDERGLRFQVLPILIMLPLNIGISWWLTGVVGAAGPIIGSAISVLICQVIPNYVYVRRDLRHRIQQAEKAAPEAEEARPHGG